MNTSNRISHILRPLQERVSQVVYGDQEGVWTRYLTRIFLTPRTRLGQLRIHIFHRGDGDPDLHDHPSNFWTFPLTSYVEEFRQSIRCDASSPSENMPIPGCVRRQTVEAWRWHFRPAEYAHRVVCRHPDNVPENATTQRLPDPAQTPPRKIITLVWWKPKRRSWGFWVADQWIPWRTYVYGETA